MNWAGFLARLPAQMQRYKRQGIAAADVAFAVDFQLSNGRNTALQTGTGAVTLVNQTGFGEIRYTLDGSMPTLQSKRYSTPLVLETGSGHQGCDIQRRRLAASCRAYVPLQR